MPVLQRLRLEEARHPGLHLHFTSYATISDDRVAFHCPCMMRSSHAGDQLVQPSATATGALSVLAAGASHGGIPAAVEDGCVSTVSTVTASGSTRRLHRKVLGSRAALGGSEVGAVPVALPIGHAYRKQFVVLRDASSADCHFSSRRHQQCTCRTCDLCGVSELLSSLPVIAGRPNRRRTHT